MATDTKPTPERLPRNLPVEPVEVIGIGIAAWKRLWRLSFGTNIVQGVLNVGLIVAVVILASRPPIIQDYTVNDQGQLERVIPLPDPMLGDSAVLTFAQRAVEDSFSLGFANYRLDMQRARKFYTESGWDGYLAALRRSRDLLAIRRRQLDMSIIVSGPPTVTHQGEQSNGRYGWEVQMPVRLVFSGDGERNSTAWILVIHLQRRSNVENPYGIGIVHFRMVSA
jgi:intracellular multiplication protein IcmL